MWLGSGVVVVAAALFLVYREASARRAAVLEHGRRLRDELAVVVPHDLQPHSPLEGSTIDGEATANYTLAATAWRAAWPDEAEFDALLSRLQAAELPADTEAILSRSRATIDAMAAGARATRIDFGALRSDLEVLNGPAQPRGPAFTLHLALRHQVQQRAFDAALETTVVFLTWSRDLAASGIRLYELLAGAGDGCVAAAWNDDALRTADETQLRRLAALLRTHANTSPPLARSGLGDSLYFLERWTDPAAPAQVRTSDVRMLIDLTEARRATESAVWSARNASLRAKPDVLRASAVFDPESEVMLRRCRTDLRMLAACVAHHVREPAAFVDPLGDGDLTIETRDEATIVVRSAGLDEGKPIERAARRR